MAEDEPDADGDAEGGDDAAPLGDLADRIRSRRSGTGSREPGTEESGDAPVDERFQASSFEEIVSEELWNSLDQDESTLGVGVEAGETPDEHIVPKRSYCENCEHFSQPPAVHCNHAGTTIVEFADLDHVRVRNCPIVEERRELSELGAGSMEPEMFEGPQAE